MTITEKLKNAMEARAKAWQAAKDLLDAKSDANGTLSAEDAASYDKIEADIVKADNEIKRLERAKKMEDQLSAPINTPLLSQPGSNSDKPTKTGRASDEYRKAAVIALRTKFNKISDILQEGVAADGGYLVPEEWDSRLMESLNADNIMREIATVIPTTSTHKIPVVSTKPSAAWLDEGEALTFANEKFSQLQLDAHKLGVAVKVTEELLQDSIFDIESHLMVEFAAAISNAEEDKFMSGAYEDNTPTGIFDEDYGGIVAQTLTAALKADNVVDLTYALRRGYRKNACFIMNDKTVAAVRKLKDGNGAFMWQPSLIAGEPDTLLGYPLRTSEFAPETGIAFGDFKYYNIGDRGTKSFSRLNELYAENGMIGFVAKERVDGILTVREAVQLLKLAE